MKCNNTNLFAGSIIVKSCNPNYLVVKYQSVDKYIPIICGYNHVIKFNDIQISILSKLVNTCEMDTNTQTNINTHKNPSLSNQ